MRKLVLENRKIIYFWDRIEIGNASISAKALLMVIMSVTQCTVYVMLRDDVRSALIDMPHRLLSDVPMLGMCRKIIYKSHQGAHTIYTTSCSSERCIKHERSTYNKHVAPITFERRESVCTSILFEPPA